MNPSPFLAAVGQIAREIAIKLQLYWQPKKTNGEITPLSFPKNSYANVQFADIKDKDTVESHNRLYPEERQHLMSDSNDELYRIIFHHFVIV